MKKLLFLVLTLGALVTPKSYGQQGLDHFEIQVDGLGCPFCAYGLEKKFKEFKGIRDVAIEIETGNFTFSYPADKALSMEAVNQQVEKAGYTPITTKILRASGEIVQSEIPEQKPAGNLKDIVQKSIRVAGNCEMCQARIHGVLGKLDGVSNAHWDIASKMLKVDFDSKRITLDQIEKRIAEVGHDTPRFKAKTSVYEALPPCCLYPRNSK